MSDAAQRFWRRQARLLALRANVGFWFTRWARGAMVTGLVASPLLLLARRRGGSFAVAGAAVAMLAVLAAGAWMKARKERYAPADGLVRLEASLGLHNRLSAAAAGVGPWPSAELFKPPLRWKRRRVATPAVFALGLFTAVALVPLSSPEAAPGGRPEPPLAWRQAEDWLKGLEQSEVVRPDSLDSFDKRLKQLEAQPEGGWYRENSLEAGDTLRDQLRTEIRAMATDLDAAASALEMAEGRSAAPDTDASRLEGQVRSLESRALALKPDLLRRLKDAAQARRRVQPLDASSLKRTLREGAGFCRLTLRECREGDKDCIAVAGRRPGNGGVDRGPGTAPLTLDPDSVHREPGRIEGVTSEDLREAALGEVVATSVGRPRVEQGTPRTSAGGEATTGTGGEAVGRSVLSPEEKRVLERYFKK